jgi:hypothetical protein
MSIMWKSIRKVVGALALTVAIGVPIASIAPPAVEATAPDAPICNGNNAFCGYTLHVKNGSTTVIPSKSFGAHYGPGWSIPGSANNSTGTGFCLADAFFGVPVGPVNDRPLPAGWTQAGIRQAAYILSMFAGDRVSPYQPIAIDAAGEFTGFTTRQRYLAAHLALSSVLPTYMGGSTYLPLLDPATLQLFSDAAGTNPSSQQVVVPLVQQMVAAATAHNAAGSNIVLSAEETAPGVVTVAATKDGLPVPNLPIWPTSTTGVAYTGTTSSQAYLNGAAAGWPSLDYTTTRAGAGVTNASGQATFTATAAALSAGVEFNTEEAPGIVHMTGDGLNSQDNLSWLASEIRLYSVPLSVASEFGLSSQVSNVSPAPGATLTDALLVVDLPDGVTLTAQVQLFDLTIDPTGAGTPLVDVTVPGLGNGTSTGHAAYDTLLSQAGHTLGYRHRAVSLSDGSLLEPTAWSELGIPSETGIVQDLVAAETHLRKTVSGDGSNWFNVQRETSPSYSPDPATADPRDGSHDDAPADAGDAIPVFAAGTPISFRYDVWLDAASTGVVTFENGTTGVVTDDNGTPAEPGDDFQPVYVSGDDGDAVLEAGETWLYEAAQIRTAVAGEVYTNYSAIPAGEVHRPDNPDGPSEGTTTPREDPAGYVVPLCSTTAVNPADGTNYVSPDGGTIADTVSCTNLPVGESATVSGEAQSKQPDGSVIATGITASSTFTPTEWPSSSTVVTFTVPSSVAPGLYVVFETITSTETGETVAVHHDPEDEAQSFVVRSPITVTTQTCAPVVTAPKGAKTGLTCDRITVYGDPGDVVTGTSTAYPWVNGVRQCGTPGAVAPWMVTIDATGVGFVETAMVAVPVGPDWEWIESASTADGRQFMRDCATSPRDTNESFAMRKGGGGGNIPSTGTDSMLMLQLGGVLVGVGAAMSLLVLRRRLPAVGM